MYPYRKTSPGLQVFHFTSPTLEQIRLVIWDSTVVSLYFNDTRANTHPLKILQDTKLFFFISILLLPACSMTLNSSSVICYPNLTLHIVLPHCLCTSAFPPSTSFKREARRPFHIQDARVLWTLPCTRHLRQACLMHTQWGSLLPGHAGVGVGVGGRLQALSQSSGSGVDRLLTIWAEVQKPWGE